MRGVTEMAGTKKAEEIERIAVLIEPLLHSRKKDDTAALNFIIGSLMSGSCTKKQQARNRRLLRLFLDALRGLEEKHDKKYEHTTIIAEYLE